jgi:hypothetical protein
MLGHADGINIADATPSQHPISLPTKSPKNKKPRSIPEVTRKGPITDDISVVHGPITKKLIQINTSCSFTKQQTYWL